MLALSCFGTVGLLPLSASAPVVRTIDGGRLTITLGDDTSFQVQDSHYEWPAFYPSLYCEPGTLGETGTLVSIGGVVYGPDFAENSCGIYAPPFVVPWTPVSISMVRGTGTTADPFAVTIVADAGPTGLRLTEVITHVAGSTSFLPKLFFSNVGSSPVTFETFLASHMYLSIQYVWPILYGGAPGGWAAEKLGAPTPSCSPHPYFVTLPAADRYTGHDVSVMWSEIQSGHLSNTMDSGCDFGGIATQWTERTINPGASLLLGPSGGVAFHDTQPFPAAATPVPALSATGLLIAIGAVAAVGWTLTRWRTR